MRPLHAQTARQSKEKATRLAARLRGTRQGVLCWKSMSGNTMPSLDTNCLLRWLLGDIPEQAALVTAVVNSGENVVLADAALIETVFVLDKIKKISRKTIEKAIVAVMGIDSISCNREIFIEVFPIYIKHPKLSFVDCYLDVLARRTGATPLLTFDKKLANQLSGTRLLSPNCG